VVRFQAPTDATVDTGNMLSDSEREINSHLKRTIMLAGGQDSYAKATASGDIRWEGFEPSTAAESTALQQLASTQITAREEAADAGSVRMKLGTTPLSGRYRPWEEVRLDDLVTVHTGTGEWDYDEATYPVAGLKIELQKSGAWHAWAELGASFSPGADRRFQVTPPTAHIHPPNPELCRIGHEGTTETTRLYPSLGNHAFVAAASALWDHDESGPSFQDNEMTATPSNTTSGASSDASVGTGGVDVRLAQFTITMDSAMAAVVAAGGAALHAQFRAKSRHGIGIDESAQKNISQITVRVFDSGGTLRGTAYAGHSLASEAGSTIWLADAATRNASFPPAAASDVLSAVAGTVATDRLVVEVGYRSFSTATTGATLYTNDSAASDLPEGDSGSTNLRSWIQFSAAGVGAFAGDLPLDTVHQDEEATGTSVRAARCDHQHAHGLLSEDGTDYHDFPVPVDILSDDTPLVEDGGGDPGVAETASRSDHVHPADAGGAGGGGVTIMAPTSDTYVNSQLATTNFDTGTTMLIGNTWATASFTRFALLTFDISSLAGTSIGSAVLSLVRTDATASAVGDLMLKARKVLRAYHPTQVTWNIWQTGSNWTTVGGQSLGNDISGERYGGWHQPDNEQFAEVQLDIGRMLQVALDASETDLRVMLGWNRNTSGSNIMEFASIENATAAYRPKLRITHS
jgi:hypothetical protein